MDLPATLLCKNPGATREKRLEQALMCAAIDGYTDATAELSCFITRLYRDKDPMASTVHRTLKPLIEIQDRHYKTMVEVLNQ